MGVLVKGECYIQYGGFYTNISFYLALEEMSVCYCVVEIRSLTRVLLIQTHSLLFLRCSPLPGETQRSPLFLTLLSLLPEHTVHGRHNSLQAALASSIPLVIKCFMANPRGLSCSTGAPGSALPKLSACCWASYSPGDCLYLIVLPASLIPPFHPVSAAFSVDPHQQLPFDF